MSNMSDLRKRLQEHKVRAAGQLQQEFLPLGCLEQLLNHTDVLGALANPAFGIPLHKREDTAEIIAAESRKIFAILVELRLEFALATFIENNILDSALPVNETQLKDIIPDDARRFVKHQWDYLAYEFRKGTYQYKIQAERILPYLEETKITPGGFSDVYKVLIHPAHQNIIRDASQKTVHLVRKRITRLGPGFRPQDESELLCLLGSLKHKNIVKLLATYSQAGVPNLLFELADLNLHEFLLLSPRQAGFEENTSIFRALHGVSSGLEYLHNFRFQTPDSNGLSLPLMHGYHHDIKPKNILVRGNDFILADFGLSKLKSLDEETKTIWKNATAEYGAPECQDPVTFQQGKVGRASDIWSLSCILSEVMVYMEDGATGVKVFRDRRLIDNIHGKTRYFHHNMALNPAVKTDLKQIETKTSSLATSSLCVLIEQMFLIHADKRPHAEKVVRNLAHITMTAFVEELLQVIEKRMDAPIDPTDANVFKTKLGLERNRLRAWAGVLGLIPIDGHCRTSEQQAFTSFAEICFRLESAINELTVPCHFEATQYDHDFIISTLHHANNSIRGHLSDAKKASMDSTFVMLSTVDVDPKSLQRIETVAMSREFSQYNHVGAVAAMKYMSILLSRGSQNSRSSLRLEPSLFERDAGVDRPEIPAQTYWYSYGYQVREREKVLVEWTGYGVNWMKDPASAEFAKVGEIMFSRTQELVAQLMHQLKLTKFRVLDCLGFVHDTLRQQFGIVYKYPNPHLLPVSLHWLIQGKYSQPVRPHPGEKLAIATALIDSMHSFHMSGWVHKNMTSYNILFFTASPGKWDGLDFSKPYVIGFNHSRQDHSSEYTEGPDDDNPQREYQHPDYRSGSSAFRRIYDYYSLGLVLLEIGTWSCLSDIYGRYPTSSPLALKEKYVECCNKQLLELMGPIYQDVTKTCLQTASECVEEGLETALNFQRDVVDKLRTCAF